MIFWTLDAMALRDEAYLTSAWQAGQVGLGEAGGGGDCMQASATPWPLRDGLGLRFAVEYGGGQ